MIQTRLKGFLICLDYSTKMLKTGRIRNRNRDRGLIRGLFESLPIRDGVLSFTTAAFALRDSIHKEKVLREIRRVLKIEGVLLVVDIGKPNNPVVRGIFSLYMRHIVPILGGLAAGYGYRNPWSLLYRTYDLLPVNLRLQEMMERTLGHAKLEELAFGGLIIALAEKREEK